MNFLRYCPFILTALITLNCYASPPTNPNQAPSHEIAIGNILLGEMAVDRDQLSAAQQYYAAATQLSHDPRAAKRALYLALMSGQNNVALQAAQQWAALAPKNLEAQLINIDLLLKLGKAEQTIPYIMQALSLDNRTAINTIINELQQAPLPVQQSLQQALTALPASQQTNPNLLLISSLLSFQTGSPEQAFTYINAAINQRPEWPQAIALKIDYLVNTKQINQALQFAAEKAKTYPHNLTIQLIDAEMLIKAKQNEAATAKLKQLTQQPEIQSVAFLILAQMAIQDQRINEASRYLKEAAKDPEQANSAYYLLGEIYQFQKEPQQAIQAYQHVKRGPYYLQAQTKVVTLFASSGNNEQALEALAAIKIQDAEEARQVVLLQVELLMNMNQPAAALNVLNHAIAAIPNDISLLYARSMVTHVMKDDVQTEKDLKAILALDPKQPVALNALGYLLINNPARYKEALGYTKQALALSPSDPAILDTMGWLEYRQGNYIEASHYLAQAYKLDYDGLIAAHYGEVLWHLGNKVGAQKVWKNGLQKFPDNPDLQAVFQKYVSP